MGERLGNVYRLGLKELQSLRYDPVMVFLIVYTFTFAIYAVSRGAATDVHHAGVAVVDEDHSTLSRRIHDALLEPYFRPPTQLNIREIDPMMDAGRYTFVIDIPPDLQADVLAGRRPVIQINVDATAMSLAGIGASYLEQIIAQEVGRFLADGAAVPAVALIARVRFNPNLQSVWFLSAMQIINNLTLLSIVLTGAALIREREHGTLEHLLVMPLTPVEIMLAKVWANGLVILIAALLSLNFMVRGVLGVPIAGSIPLFALGTAVYLFAVTSLGIFLATIARSMPQFGLLSMPVFIVMNLLSGTNTPLESMPAALQYLMQCSPSTHFAAFAQAVLYRAAGLEIVWPQLAAVAAIGSLLFAAALLRFRNSITVSRN